MPGTGDSRLVRRVAIVVFLLAAVGGVWWWKHVRDPDTPATATVTQSRSGAPPSAVAVPRGAAVAPARLAVTVTDDRGPLADAMVRLVPGDGEVVVIKTGSDGVAHADPIEPGAWTVSASAADHVPAALATRRLAAGADEKLAIRLARGGRALSGTVSDATGGPIAGARIDAARVNAVAEPSDAVSTTFTGADGKYRMSVAEGELLVAAASPDYAPQSRYVEVGPAGAVADFSLVPGGAIEGVVRDERTREPVAGAAVVARRDSPAMLLAEPAARRTLSSSDGRFRIGGLRPGAWELTASDPVRRSKAETIVGIGVAEQVTDVELLIGAGPVIRGRVVDDTGAPAPDVEIRALAQGDVTRGRADATGAFALTGLRPGNYALTASSAAYLPAGAVRVPLADTDVDGVTVTVRRGNMIRGHVEPRQVCDIRQEPSDRGGEIMFLPPGTTSGPDGEFALGPSGDGPGRLTARCGSGDQGRADVEVRRAMPEIVLKVAPGGAIAGRVVDGEGKPVAGVAVMASNVSGGRERTTIRNGMITSGVQDLTDAGGAYQLEGLSPGSYRIGALDRGKPLHLRTRSPVVELAASERKTGVDLAIDRPDGVIDGRVTGPDGAPLADAWVSVHQDVGSLFDSMRDADRGEPTTHMVTLDNSSPGGAPESSYPPALTDAQGRFAIRGLTRTAYTVVAEAQRGQLRARVNGIQPNATVELRALSVTSLSGTVVSTAGPSALFSAELDGPTRAQRSFSDGKFSFARVDPGSYTVRVQSSDGNGEATVEVRPGEAATVDIKLSANAVVVGTLLDPAGQPIAGQALALAPDTGGPTRLQFEGAPVTTDQNGRFRLEHRAEKMMLIVLRQPRPFTRRGLVLEAGKTLDLGAITVDTPATPGPSQRSAQPGGPEPARPPARISPLDPGRV